MNIYDRTNFNPPAAVCEAKIISPPLPHIGIDEASIDMEMLLDTGADVGCLPLEVIEELERRRGFQLPYTFDKVMGVDGRLEVYKCYDLIMETSVFSNRREIQFVVVPGGEAIIGRDVLNEYAILYDGPNMGWEVK